MQFAHNAYGGLTDGDGSWAADTAFGSNQFMFAEDNVISGLTRYGTAQDCNAGGRFVWRYNRMTAASLQTHPTGGAGRGRGCRAAEIYGNLYNNAGLTESLLNVFFISSGTAMVWGNTFPDPSEFKHFLTVHSMRGNNSTYPQAATPDGWGYCGTAFNGTGSNWDGNSSASTGYPCLDQPGRGKGDLLTGSFPNTRNSPTGCTAGSPCGWPRQALEPIYMWRNPFTPMPGWGGSLVGGDWGGVAPNRDWYADEGASCAAGSPACATGVGVGTRAQRPTNCTVGTAWWSTDQGGDWNHANTSANDGTLDKCTATNTWTNAFYTPYTYPHPLVTGTTPPVSTPARPTNVRIVP
jgi:hypothetical protein